MSKFVKDTDLGYGSFTEKMRDIARNGPFVKVGVLGKSDSELVQYAGANEFGTQDGRVPERSFIRSTMNRIGFALFKKSEDFLAQMAKNRITPEKALAIMGEFVKGKIVLTIETIKEPPNAPSTVIAKKGVDNPLIDEGRMRNAIDYEVVK